MAAFVCTRGLGSRSSFSIKSAAAAVFMRPRAWMALQRTPAGEHGVRSPARREPAPRAGVGRGPVGPVRGGGRARTGRTSGRREARGNSGRGTSGGPSARQQPGGNGADDGVIAVEEL